MCSVTALQDWCRDVCEGYSDVQVTDMSSSFTDGLAFCAIIHKHRPELLDFHALSKHKVYENMRLAFVVAERELGIPALLDPDELMCVEEPDLLSIITYVSQLYCVFGGKPHDSPKIPEPGRTQEQTHTQFSTDVIRSSDKRVCSVCHTHVHLIQRVLVKGRLYHRSCFRCSRCRRSLLPMSFTEASEMGSLQCSYPCKPAPEHDRPADTAETDGDRRETDGDRRETDGVRRETDGVRRETDGVRREMDGVRRETDGDRRETDRDRRETDGVRREMDGVRRETDGVRRETDRDRRETDGVRRETDGVRRETDGVRRETDGVRRETDGDRRETDGVRRETDGVRRETDGVRRETDGVRRETDGDRRETDRDKMIERYLSTSSENNIQEPPKPAPRKRAEPQEPPCPAPRSQDHRPDNVRKDHPWMKLVDPGPWSRLPPAPAPSAHSRRCPYNPFLKDDEDESKDEEQSPLSFKTSVAQKPQTSSSVPSMHQAAAPAHGFPLIKRKVITDTVVSEKEVCEEQKELEERLLRLERRGVQLEREMRRRTDENLLVDWFILIHKKNMLVRRDAELVYMLRQRRLEQQQADVEFELRCLFNKPEEDWSSNDRQREHQLMSHLLSIIQQRNDIISSLDLDRQREVEEDMRLSAVIQRTDLLTQTDKELERFSRKFKGLQMFKASRCRTKNSSRKKSS